MSCPKIAFQGGPAGNKLLTVWTVVAFQRGRTRLGAVSTDPAK